MYKAAVSYYPSYVEREAIKALDGVLGVYLTQTYSYDYGWEGGRGRGL